MGLDSREQFIWNGPEDRRHLVANCGLDLRGMVGKNVIFIGCGGGVPMKSRIFREYIVCEEWAQLFSYVTIIEFEAKKLMDVT